MNGTHLQMKTVAIRDDGAFSVLLWDGQPFAVSVERTFEDGRPIIRSGLYLCKRDRFHRGGYDTYQIDVPGHDRVLFHRGNTEADSMGCVIVAESFGILRGRAAVLESRSGFDELMGLARRYNEFFMEVTGR